MLAFLSLALLSGSRPAASDHYGQVTFGGVAGAGRDGHGVAGRERVVHVHRSARHLQARGSCRWLVDDSGRDARVLDDHREVTIAGDAPPATWELTLLPFDEIDARDPADAGRYADTARHRSGRSRPRRQDGARGPASTPRHCDRQGFQRAGVNASAPAPPAATKRSARVLPEPTSAEAAMGAADGFLINGSVNNGAASPFAQPRAFGNNRRASDRSTPAASAFSAATPRGTRGRSRSRASRARSPPTTTCTSLGTFGGPLRIPGPAQERRQPLRRLPAHRRSQRQHAVGADADARSSAAATSRRRATRWAARSDSSIRQPGCRSPGT